MILDQATKFSEERLQTAPENIERQGNVDVFAASTGEIALCHVYFMGAFTDGISNIDASGAQEQHAAIALAIQHFNTRNNTIVPSLTDTSDALQNCPIRLSMEAHDTQFQQLVAVEQVIEATDRPLQIPSDDGTAIPVVTYLHNVLGVNFLAVININDSYGNGFILGLQAAAKQYTPNLFIQQVDISIDATPENIKQAVSFLKDTQYTYFFGILYPQSIVYGILEEAHRQGIAGTGRHNWFFSDSVAVDILNEPFPRTSPLVTTIQGSGLIAASAGLPQYNPGLAQLAQAFDELRSSPDDLEYLNAHFPPVNLTQPPLNDDGSFLTYDIYSDVYLSETGIIPPFSYDATIALGMSACRAWQDDQLDGAAHFDEFTKLSFQGATGLVQFNAQGTRIATTAAFPLQNFLIDEERSTNDVVYFKQVLTDLFQEGEWIDIQDFVFNDGTSTIPSDLPPADAEPNHLSPGLRIAGLCLAGIAMALSIGFACWTTIHRESKVVKASQPIFLNLICAGVCIMSSSIIPWSIDTGVASVAGCDIACVALPWLLVIGFSTVSSALFTKTRRINMIFSNPSFKRIRVTPMDVARPMFALMGINIIILTIWTALSPLQWTIEVEERDVFGRIIESYGHCDSDNYVAFNLTLGIVNFTALVFTVQQAHKAREISLEYSESQYLFKAIMSIMLVCVVGLPVILLASESQDALFFVTLAIIFSSACSILLFIFVPKIYFLRQSKTKKKEHVHVSGLMMATDHSGFSDAWRHSHTSDDDDHHDESHGMRVISSKTKDELLKENHRMKRESKELSAKHNLLKEASKRWMTSMTAPPEMASIAVAEMALDDEPVVSDHNNEEVQPTDEECAPLTAAPITDNGVDPIRGLAEEETDLSTAEAAAVPLESSDPGNTTVNAAANDDHLEQEGNSTS